MNRAHTLLPFLAPLLLAGCAASSYCKGVQPYERAVTIEPLQGTERLQLPESASALRIPPRREDAPAFGERYANEDGDVRYRCLDVPPRLQPPAETAPASQEAIPPQGAP